MTSAFHQTPLDKESMKYCGVATPFKGVRVYTRTAMGMPGSETALEELLSQVLGNLIQEGVVAKLADDLYCGGNTPEDLLINWDSLLSALFHNGLRLSAPKTVIAPKSTTILGWIWSQETIKASPHCTSALTTCDPPSTSKGLCSFIGPVKVLAQVIPHCSHYLLPLEDAVAGRQSAEKISWSESLLNAFNHAKQILGSSKTIHLPQPKDQLWVVTDGAVKAHGLGATLYITHDKSKPQLAGYFSAKLRKRQIDWQPCELEALCIAASVSHFSPYIIKSAEKTCVLTDSQPCVQAYHKLSRVEFSASSRITTFLTAVSRYRVSVRHLSGAANTLSDFTCHNAEPCTAVNCQICNYIAHMGDSVVRGVSVQDVISGTTKLPYSNRSAWHETQSECSDLHHTLAHLSQCTCPSKKATNIKDIKRYLQVATIASDGLIVVHKTDPFSPARECVIIPRSVFPGLVTALHIKLNHPSPH